MRRRIYVASSWRNAHQPMVVETLRGHGHEVYDFRNPAPGIQGFAWKQTGIGDDARSIPSYLQAVESGRAREAFAYDKAALDWCDTCVLVLPCGRSAHLEAGYTAGQGKDTYFFLHPDQFEPELMYKLGHGASDSLSEICHWLGAKPPANVMRWHTESGGHFGRPASHAVRLLREVVELCIAAGATQEEIEFAALSEVDKAEHRGEIGGDPSKMPEEWADCAMLLGIFGEYARIDGHAEIRKKLAVLWERKWMADAGGALYRPAVQP